MIENLIFQGNLEELKKTLGFKGVDEIKCNDNLDELAAGAFTMTSIKIG